MLAKIAFDLWNPPEKFRREAGGTFLQRRLAVVENMVASM